VTRSSKVAVTLVLQIARSWIGPPTAKVAEETRSGTMNLNILSAYRHLKIRNECNERFEYTRPTLLEVVVNNGRRLPIAVPDTGILGHLYNHAKLLRRYGRIMLVAT
jgi:hypothetical protein